MGKQAIENAKRLNAFGVDPDNLVIVGLDTKHKEGEHPLWDERIKLPIEESLIRNIMQLGVCEPVLVRKNGEALEVVDGRRRVLHARVANGRLREMGSDTLLVPVMVRRDDAAGSLGVMIALNEQREDDMPLTRARKAQRLLNLGKDETYVADCFNLSTQQIKNLLTLLELDETVQKTVERGELGATAAIQLKDLSHDEQRTKAKELIASGAGVAEAKRQKQARSAKKNGHASSNGSSDDDGARGKRPSVSVLRKVADHKDFVGTLSPDARDILLWIMGDETRIKRIKGLTDTLRELGVIKDADAE